MIVLSAEWTPYNMRQSLDWGNEFTSVQFLVFHVSITESRLGALPSRVPIHLRRAGAMMCQRLRNSHPPRKCHRTIRDLPSLIKEIPKCYPRDGHLRIAA